MFSLEKLVCNSAPPLKSFIFFASTWAILSACGPEASLTDLSSRSRKLCSDQVLFEVVFSGALKQTKARDWVSKDSFEKLNDYFGRVRREIQKYQKFPIQAGKLEHFGAKRFVGLETPFVPFGPYAGGFNRLSSEIDEVIKAGGRLDHGDAFLEAIMLSSGEMTRMYRLGIRNPLLDHPDSILELTSFIDLRQSDRIQVIHTAAEELESVLKVVKRKFSAVVAMKSSDMQKVDVYKAIGEFHWWFTHATPFIRGSSAVGKMHVLSLLQFHGMGDVGLGDLLRFEKFQGLDLDVWALTHFDPISYGQLFEQAIKRQIKVHTPLALDSQPSNPAVADDSLEQVIPRIVLGPPIEKSPFSFD